jgi:hydroxymethylglutaryl-CoA reductase
MPLSVGTKGGAIESNPSYLNTHSILGFPSSVELGYIMMAVGLAQNLAALRALSMEGI